MPPEELRLPDRHFQEIGETTKMQLIRSDLMTSDAMGTSY
jgi:hypothetical protein